MTWVIRSSTIKMSGINVFMIVAYTSDIFMGTCPSVSITPADIIRRAARPIRKRAFFQMECEWATLKWLSLPLFVFFEVPEKEWKCK
jgi:hypothetical protein